MLSGSVKERWEVRMLFALLGLVMAGGGSPTYGDLKEHSWVDIEARRALPSPTVVRVDAPSLVVSAPIGQTGKGTVKVTNTSGVPLRIFAAVDGLDWSGAAGPSGFRLADVQPSPCVNGAPKMSNTFDCHEVPPNVELTFTVEFSPRASSTSRSTLVFSIESMSQMLDNSAAILETVDIPLYGYIDTTKAAAKK